jgi:ABC-type lipoprotein release transport system permease subunit
MRTGLAAVLPAAAIVLVVALCASLLPAHRAGTVAAADALRGE